MALKVKIADEITLSMPFGVNQVLGKKEISMNVKNDIISIKDILTEECITSSAPCRIDCGGTWDLKPFVLPYHNIQPSTVNIAINLRTKVTLSPYEEGWIYVSSKGFVDEKYPSKEAPFNTPMGFVFAVATYFNITGVRIEIESESPPKSALGGSGVLGVALINAFSKALLKKGKDLLSREQMVKLAYHIEDGLSVSLTGMQDQAAAAFGGINMWTWIQQNGFEREELIPRSQIKDVEPHILIAYCGKSHKSTDVNSKWVDEFLNGKNRFLWFEINELTKEFAKVIKRRDWSTAAQILQKENDIRQSITPEVLIPSTRKLIEIGRENQCGARFAGAGGGGCVWAIGEEEKIRDLRKEWQIVLLRDIENGVILKSDIDIKGVV